MLSVAFPFLDRSVAVHAASHVSVVLVAAIS